MRPELIFTLIAVVAVFAACSGRQPSNLGVTDGKLRPCPESPNCVSSQATDPAHFVEPIKYEGTRAAAKEKLTGVITSMKRAVIINDTENYVRAEFTSALFRFVDDVECYFDDAKKIIHVRSASRVGYGDMGVNRKRIEMIRDLFNRKRATP